MTETFGAWWQAALSLLTQLYDAALTFAAGLDPLTWWAVGGALLVALLLWLLLRRREPGGSGRPEVLVSLGAISAAGEVSGAEPPQRFSLRLTVSNLNPYTVQVLELALKTPEMAVPVTAEVAAVVPPEGSVVLEEALPELTGEEGRLNLYFYTAGRKRLWRLQTTFALEPWNDRYKISPLGQSITPARQLASAAVGRVHERAWREREGHEEAEYTAQVPRSQAPRSQAPWLQMPKSRERGRERTPEVVSYPEPTEAPRQGGMSFPDEF